MHCPCAARRVAACLRCRWALQRCKRRHDSKATTAKPQNEKGHAGQASNQTPRSTCAGPLPPRLRVSQQWRDGGRKARHSSGSLRACRHRGRTFVLKTQPISPLSSPSYQPSSRRCVIVIVSPFRKLSEGGCAVQSTHATTCSMLLVAAAGCSGGGCRSAIVPPAGFGSSAVE